MKKIITFLILIINFSSYSQEEKITKSEKYIFPIKTKFTLKVTPTKAGDFKYSIIKVEPYDKVVDNIDDVFKKKGEKETIEFCFCLEESKFGGTENQNTDITLLMKSRSKYSFKFKTEIQTEKDGEFKEVSNVGAHKGSITSESWAQIIYQIKISEIEIKK